MALHPHPLTFQALHDLIQGRDDAIDLGLPGIRNNQQLHNTPPGNDGLSYPELGMGHPQC